MALKLENVETSIKNRVAIQYIIWYPTCKNTSILHLDNFNWLLP